MAIIVQKYGGSSVKDKNTLELVCNKIIREKEKDNDVVVVVSAQGKTTNELISKSKEYTNGNDNIDLKSLDFLLSTGEMQTAALLSLMLNSKGYTSVCLNGNQAGILTDSNFGNAKIQDIITDNITYNLNSGNIVIVTGFQGIDKMGNITTLGRGGSDLTAVAIASYLKAQKCEIYSDVDGIYTADPRIIPNTRLLDNISYDEMIDAASNGAKVLHNRSVCLAKKNNIEILSRSTFSEDYGSKVNATESIGVHFISKQDNLTKISIIGSMLKENNLVISDIFSIANENNIQIYMIDFSEHTINLIVDNKNSIKYMKLLHNKLIEKEE